MLLDISATSSNNNHLSSHEKVLLKKRKRKRIQKYRGLDQNSFVNKKLCIGRLYLLIKKSKSRLDENLLNQ